MLFPTVKGIDTLHLIFCQMKMIQFCILFDMIRITGAGNHNNALLQIPA